MPNEQEILAAQLEDTPTETRSTHHCHGPNGLHMERNHFFTGKYMTARDFRAEQYYFLSHHLWHNWALHSWGIVWGLNVKIEDNSETQCVTICPGMAIDCHGRELALPYPVQFPIRHFTHSEQAAELGENFLLGLKFACQPREYVPLLLNDEDCESEKRTFNRAREY